MKVFFDTEFTGLQKDTSLISIGLIDENERTFYAEFNDYNENQVDDWVRKNVINHLINDSNKIDYESDNWYVVGDKDFIATILEKWLSLYDEVQLVSDCCHYDMVLFIDIFGSAFDIPRQVCPTCHDINQDLAKHYNKSEREAFDLSREGIIETYNEIIKENWPEEVIIITGDKHNALYDAKVIRAIFRLWRMK